MKIILRPITTLVSIVLMYNTAFAQVSTDCTGALRVCNTSSLIHTQSDSYGNWEADAYWGCLQAGEIRSAWYYFQIQTSGTFGFSITPNPMTFIDCDFALWGPFTSKSCPMNTIPLRCSYAISWASNSYGLPGWTTGLQSGATDFSEGASGDAFVHTVDALAGEWYVLLVEVHSGSLSYNITWNDNIPFISQATFSSAPTASEAAISANGSTSFCSGESVVLDVDGTGLMYQWKKNGSVISGATNQSLTVTESGSYQADVSDSCGTTTSNSIVITVDTAPSAAQATITTGGPTIFCKGSKVELSVAAAGLIYQWEKGNSVISGATQQSYMASKTGTYKCVVTNSCGSITSNSISVTVNPTPVVSVSQAPCSQGTVLLTCTSNPNSGITFQWQKGNIVLNGATNSNYSATTKGKYKCTVTITSTGCSKISVAQNVTITCKIMGDINQNDVIVYPNPSNNYFLVNTSSLDQPCWIYIYDLTGRLVESHQANAGEMKVGEALANGVYFLKVEVNNEPIRVIKLIKN